MQPFDIKRGGRTCSHTDEPLLPGASFYSALVETNSSLQRRDYCEEAWKQQSIEDSDGVVGWWKQQVPQLDGGKVYWAPDEVLIAYFDSLQLNKETEAAWVMALLLLQKRLLTRQADCDESDQCVFVKCRKNGKQYEVREPDLSPQQILDIQKQLAENLFSDRPLGEDR